MTEYTNESFSSTLNELFERAPEAAYLEMWTKVLSQDREASTGDNVQSIVVFRIGKDWLGLSTQVFSEIAEMRVIRKIPHRSNGVLKGIVNLRGQLRLCVDLAMLLDIKKEAGKDADPHRQMVAISQNEDVWVFAVEQVLGVFICEMSTLRNVPVTLLRSGRNFLKGILTVEDKHVSLLDEDLLFYCLIERCI